MKAINMEEPRLVGVRSYAAFARGAHSVGVSRSEDSLTVHPSENQGSKGGFANKPLLDFDIPLTATDEEVGKAVLEGLNRCL
jgi:hypothetical protein